MIFEEFGGSPGNSYTWVELRDDLTVSLLQARLIELNCRGRNARLRRRLRHRIWDYCSSIETWMGLLGREPRSVFSVRPRT
jgi:hypothetical protein